jgi:hypothetical protein
VVVAYKEMIMTTTTHTLTPNTKTKVICVWVWGIEWASEERPNKVPASPR